MHQELVPSFTSPFLVQVSKTGCQPISNRFQCMKTSEPEAMEKTFETGSFDPGSTPNTELLRDCGMFTPMLQRKGLNGDFLEAVLANTLNRQRKVDNPGEIGSRIFGWKNIPLIHRSACWSSGYYGDNQDFMDCQAKVCPR